MLRERAIGESLWEAVLPAELRELPPELAKVGAVLDDDRFLAPFRSRLTATIGRPTIPVETYLRLMYLKHRYGLGYETLTKEVTDSFTWRRFCRIAIDGRVPDPSTLMKLTKRLGPELLEKLNAELLGRRRSVGKRVRRISATLARGGKTRATVDRLTAEIAVRAKATVREARRVVRNARRALAQRPRAGAALVAQLERELAAAEQILAQTDLRLSGQRTIPDRRVSLVDPDARPIRMGSPKRPTEFGYKARVADTAEGFVIVDVPARGNPHDDGLLEGAVAKAKKAGMQVRSVYADRGFGTRIGDAALREHTVGDAVIPRQGRASPVEHTSAWRRRYRFRNGLEGRISQLKRKGLRRTRLRGINGAQTWSGGLALAHNLQRIALLT